MMNFKQYTIKQKIDLKEIWVKFWKTNEWKYDSGEGASDVTIETNNANFIASVITDLLQEKQVMCYLINPPCRKFGLFRNLQIKISNTREHCDFLVTLLGSHRPEVYNEVYNLDITKPVTLYGYNLDVMAEVDKIVKNFKVNKKAKSFDM